MGGAPLGRRSDRINRQMRLEAGRRWTEKGVDQAAHILVRRALSALTLETSRGDRHPFALAATTTGRMAQPGTEEAAGLPARFAY